MIYKSLNLIFYDLEDTTALIAHSKSAWPDIPSILSHTVFPSFSYFPSL